MLQVFHNIDTVADNLRPSDVELWRDIFKNNATIRRIPFVVRTDETWLPKVLADAGFFASANQVKKNRPDWWRDIESGEVVKLKWAEIIVNVVGQTERIGV